MFDHHNKITDYIEGNLSAEDRLLFEQAMKDDKTLAKLVDEYPIYNGLADEIINHDLSTQIKNEQAQLKNTKKQLPKYAYAIAATIVALVIAYPLIYSGSSGQDLYDKYYSPPMNQHIRGEQADITTTMKGCDQGHLYLEQKEFSKAKQSFAQSLDDAEIRCQDKALYYTALIAVKDKDYIEAKRYLNIVIGNDNSGYETKAQDLINELPYH